MRRRTVLCLLLAAFLGIGIASHARAGEKYSVTLTPLPAESLAEAAQGEVVSEGIETSESTTVEESMRVPGAPADVAARVKRGKVIVQNYCRSYTARVSLDKKVRGRVRPGSQMTISNVPYGKHQLYADCSAGHRGPRTFTLRGTFTWKLVCE
jgi:C-terminal processing protease CtpA/Prc